MSGCNAFPVFNSGFPKRKRLHVKEMCFQERTVTTVPGQTHSQCFCMLLHTWFYDVSRQTGVTDKCKYHFLNSLENFKHCDWFNISYFTLKPTITLITLHRYPNWDYNNQFWRKGHLKEFQVNTWHTEN